MKNKDYIPAFNFDFLTPFYDLGVEFLGYGRSERKFVVDLLKLKKEETLLDVGCGTGTLVIIAKETSPEAEITGIDIDERVLRIAREKILKKRLEIKIIESNAEKLPFKNNSFDAIVSSLVFHHLPKEVKIAALGEIYRVLKSGGRFLLADFGDKGWVVGLWYFLSHLLNLPEAKTFEDNAKGLIPALMEKTGFKISKVAPDYRGIQFLMGTKS